MDQELFYRNINTVVRTPRFAVLVYKHEKYWKAYVNGMIQTFTQTWGGEHFIIIPTDGKTIDDCFWKILEAYSPDYIGRYLPSVSDIEEADPEHYAKIKEDTRIKWRLPDDEFEEHWEKAKETHIGGLDVDKSLSEELKNRLSPFHFQDHIVSENVANNSALGYPFTHIEGIVEHAKDRPTEIVAPIKISDPAYSLLASSRAGILSDTYAKALQDKGFTIVNLPSSPDTFPIRDYMAALESNEYDRKWQKAFSGDTKGEYPPDDFVKLMPYKLSMLHLGRFYRHDTHRDWEENKLVIIGDSMNDFCLYYGLSRLHDGVYWLPDQHLVSAHRRVVANRGLPEDQVVKWNENENIASVLVNEYWKSIRYGDDKKKLLITSATLTTRQLANRSKYMSEICLFGNVRRGCTVIALDDISTNCVMQVIELNNHANQQDVVFQNGESVGRLNTPKPKNFSYINPSEHRWITGVNIEGFRPPALPFLGHKIIHYKATDNETRSAKDGLAYFSPNVMHFGEDIDVNLVRPKLSLLSDQEMFQDYFDYSGYTTELSDKGSYLKDTLRRFGSLERVAKFFRTEANRNLFDQYITSTKDPADDEIILLGAEKRAYLGFGAFSRKLSSNEEAIAMIDELISKSIIARGLIFKCSRCRNAAWYDVANVSDKFTCTRCELEQPYTHTSWRSPAEPKWYYRLAETVYLFYKSNSHLTILALDKLRQEAPDEFHYVSETEIVDQNKRKQEIDVLAIVKGKIILGECKNTPVVADDVKKYLRIFSKLDIKPHQFLLATTENISNAVQVELDKFSNHRVMTRKDLYE